MTEVVVIGGGVMGASTAFHLAEAGVGVVLLERDTLASGSTSRAVGESPAVSRFLYATGFSGHGFPQGPAIGEVLRDLVLGHTPVIDVSALDVRRFARTVRPEHNIV